MKPNSKVQAILSAIKYMTIATVGANYLGDYPRRIYKFVPEKIWMNDNSGVNGNFIDIRVEATE